MKIAIVLNSARVSPALTEKLNSSELSVKYNISYDVFVFSPQELESRLLSINHKTYNAYIIGGGDGTVRTAAEALIDQDIPLAILPLGSFNFLAKTLQYPDDIDATFAMIKNNKTKLIDLGDINGHIFINHAWIGFYYYLLKLREKHRVLLGTNRLFKIISNIVIFFKVMPYYDLEFKVNSEVMKFKTCLVYIGNNNQNTNMMDFAERKSISHGLLSVYIFNSQSRWELFKAMLSILSNSFQDSPYVTQFLTDDLLVKYEHKHINTVIDGELLKLSTPLHYSVHKKQLAVFIP